MESLYSRLPVSDWKFFLLNFFIDKDADEVIQYGRGNKWKLLTAGEQVAYGGRRFY